MSGKKKQGFLDPAPDLDFRDPQTGKKEGEDRERAARPTAGEKQQNQSSLDPAGEKAPGQSSLDPTGEKTPGQSSLDPAGEKKTGLDPSDPAGKKDRKNNSGNDRNHRKKPYAAIIAGIIAVIVIIVRIAGGSGKTDDDLTHRDVTVITDEMEEKVRERMESEGENAADPGVQETTGEDSEGELQGTGEETSADPEGELRDTEEEAAKITPDKVYTEIVREYASLLGQDGDAFVEAYDRGDYKEGTAGLNPDINYELVYNYFCIPDYTEAHYAIRDYNEDGTPELVILLSSDGGSWGQVWAGYTFDGKKAVSLFTGFTKLGYRIDLYTLPDNLFLIHGGGGAMAGSDTICRIADGGTGLLVIDEYEYDEQANGSRDHFGSGEPVSDAEFQEKYYDVMVSASEGLDLLEMREDTVVETY